MTSVDGSIPTYDESAFVSSYYYRQLFRLACSHYTSHWKSTWTRSCSTWILILTGAGVELGSKSLLLSGAKNIIQVFTVNLTICSEDKVYEDR